MDKTELIINEYLPTFYRFLKDNKLYHIFIHEFKNQNENITLTQHLLKKHEKMQYYFHLIYLLQSIIVFSLSWNDCENQKIDWHNINLQHKNDKKLQKIISNIIKKYEI